MAVINHQKSSKQETGHSASAPHPHPLPTPHVLLVKLVLVLKLFLMKRVNLSGFKPTPAA